MKGNGHQETSIDYLTKETSDSSIFSRKRTSSKPNAIMHQAVKYTYGSTSAIPRLSSLPCIVPQAFYRHHFRKTSYSRASHHERIPELDPESLLVRRHYLTRTSLEFKRESLLERRTASFLSTRSYRGKLPGLRGSPFPLCGMNAGLFLAEPRSMIPPDDYRSSLKSSAVSSMTTKSERFATQSSIKSRYGHIRKQEQAD
ncbi:hypothetical protein L7F22_065473 [Adiantum nelumboides]|nr:hypothetical protein [Adiantum nelumboides]